MGLCFVVLVTLVSLTMGVGIGFYLGILVFHWSIVEGRWDRKTMERLYKRWESAARERAGG